MAGKVWLVGAGPSEGGLLTLKGKAVLEQAEVVDKLIHELGVEIASYHATEIDKFAIQTTQANFPDVVQLGDAFQVREMAGPMQDLPAGPRRRRNEAHREGGLLPHVRGLPFPHNGAVAERCSILPLRRRWTMQGVHRRYRAAFAVYSGLVS